MIKLEKSLQDLSDVFEKAGIEYLVTRIDLSNAKNPDDLDILVKSSAFDLAIAALKKNGYQSFSHDHALGGRRPGFQRNLIKRGRLKIDLHKDYTWRGHTYVDLDFVWDEYGKNRRAIDSFIVMVNWIFEKTYITKNEYFLAWFGLRDVFEDDRFYNQAKKNGWAKSFRLFKNYYKSNVKISSFPTFLPLGMVMKSFFEKFHLIAFLYYFYFRTRYLLNQRLPYEK